MSDSKVTLVWTGAGSVAEVVSALGKANEIRLELPRSLHHTLVMHMNPKAGAAPVERLELRGGADLLSQLAAINGLGPLTDLVAAVTAAQATVTVVSPAPSIIIKTGS